MILAAMGGQFESHNSRMFPSLFKSHIDTLWLELKNLVESEATWVSLLLELINVLYVTGQITIIIEHS